jgi:hypothetical protein
MNKPGRKSFKALLRAWVLTIVVYEEGISGMFGFQEKLANLFAKIKSEALITQEEQTLDAKFYGKLNCSKIRADFSTHFFGPLLPCLTLRPQARAVCGHTDLISSFVYIALK